MATTEATSGKGTLIQRSTDDGENFTTIAEVRDVSLSKPGQNYADATHQESPGSFPERIPVLKSYGSVSFPVNYRPGETTQNDVESDQSDQTKRTWRVLYTQCANWYHVFEGYVSIFNPDQCPLNDVLRASVTIEITGEVTKGQLA